MADSKYVYRFGKTTDGNRTMRELIGGKGANLAEMCNIGIPVPPGFTISTEACKFSIDNSMKWPEGLEDQIKAGIKHIESDMGAKLGDSENPLLISVRSGAAVSMPGMMDTILNLGINDKVVDALINKTGNERFVYDSYRRFIDMFGDVVMGVSHEYFENAIERLKDEVGIKDDINLSTEHLKELVDRYKAIYRKHTGHMFPENPFEQLKFAVNAVFSSWNSSRAIKYREISHISGLVGTGVNVQAMVFGNMSEKSSTGVCFTRNPSTGFNELYGEFLINAQGEDVVAGIRTPQPISKMKSEMPEVYDELLGYTNKLEAHYKNMQDIEFTIQEGKLFILQTRNGKRTGSAAIKIAVDLVNQGVISKEDAIGGLVEPEHIEQLLHPQFSTVDVLEKEIIGKGLPASPGAAVGKVVFSSKEAEKAAENGEMVILVRIETSPEDVGGMGSAEGILTSRGGMTSHAAVVARGWGKPCVAGCSDIVINYKAKTFTNGEITIHEGDWISLDGTRGLIIKGQREMFPPVLSEEYETFMRWVSSFESMEVRANAETPEDAELAITLGAKGIGLARTEHMFFKDDRVTAVRRMIIAETEEERRNAILELLPYQKEDFKGIFKAMDGLPVTVRLLDPPLHEFLPHSKEEVKTVAEQLGISKEILVRKIDGLKEFNPMLGHRGCRLGITHPEITEMQTRAILEAALELKKEDINAIPEIMVPLVGSFREFRNQKRIIEKVATQVFKEYDDSIEFKIGTMIEVPRAALVADKIASEAEFFSFGTNDLTQMTLGYSRDDAAKFIPQYLEEGILKEDPFQTLDIEGVGQLVQMGTELGRSTNPDIKIGICGEHGGDPASIEFCYQLGMNYVSCSPYRVPIAHLALAQSAIKDHLKTRKTELV
ncbi:MAG: pyruvate, phosphate dikinase [Balneolaceae bacterium]